jgi:hypothetical protein
MAIIRFNTNGGHLPGYNDAYSVNSFFFAVVFTFFSKSCASFLLKNPVMAITGNQESISSSTVEGDADDGRLCFLIRS